MKKLILFIISLFLVIINYAQFDPSSWRQIESDPNYLKTIPELYEKNYERYYRDSIHTEFKAYNRYKNFWHSRIGIGANGDYSYDQYINAVLNYITNPICTGSDPANWQLMGPVYHPDQQQGLFTEVLYDEDYPEKLLISSNHGGIWKFNPTNNEWYSVTDDLAKKWQDSLVDMNFI